MRTVLDQDLVQLIRNQQVVGSSPTGGFKRLAAARRRGVKLGRRPMLDQDKLHHARQLLEAGESGRHVARTLGVSHTTLYASLGR